MGMLTILSEIGGSLAILGGVGWIIKYAYIGAKKTLEASVYKSLNTALEKRIELLEKDVLTMHEEITKLTQRNVELTHLNGIYQRYLARYIPDIYDRVQAEASINAG